MEKSNDISTSGENAPEYRLAAPIPLRTYMPRASYMEQAPAQTLLDPSSLQSVSVHSESHSTYVPLYTPISLSESDSTWRTSAAHGQFGTNLPVGTTGASEATIEYLTYPTAELPDHLHQHRGQPQYHTLQPHSPITFSDLPAEASDLASNAPKPAAQRSPRYRDYEPHPRVRYGLQEAEAFDDASISHEPVIADPQDISNFVPISHHGLEHAPVLTPLANSARRERDERIGNSRTAVSYQEHTFAGHNLPQLYYASHDPTYTVHHYQDASATANHSLASQTHQEPSPTWPASPLVSPAYTATSHGTFGPRLDYFGISASQPSSTESMPDLQAHQPPRARLPSKNSSPPTSLSSVSQKSEHLSGDGELLISMRPQQNDLYARTGGQDLGVGSSSKAKSSILGVRPSAGGPARMKKQTRVVDGACRSCGTRFATINLRGHPQDFSNDFDMIYYCLDCAPNQLGVSRASLEASLGLRQDDDTASSALDMPQKEGGSSQDGHAPSSGSAQTPIRVLPRGPRKRIRATDIYSPTVCDVCSRWIAHGSPLPREAGAELSFNVEIVCNLCVNKYRRCSDCGGGGGARLG